MSFDSSVSRESFGSQKVAELGGDNFLISTTTIRAELEDYIKSEGTTLHRFSESAGVNVGTLSGIINGNRPIAIGQLDRITAAMGLPEGHFYDLYADECFTSTAPHWRRLRPFLLRCAELQKHDCIKQVLNRLLEDLKQIAGIFDTAEMMYEQGWKEAAVILYESVIESERSSHSERLAMSYYRIFQIFQTDTRRGFKAALQFLPYRYRLPEAYALDGLLMLTEIYALRFNWSEVENYADELCQFTEALYNRRIWMDEDFKPKRPLVYYYGRAYLIKSSSYEYRGMFEESKKWIPKYADLSWFEGLDEAGKAEVEQLKMFAYANWMCMDIKSGNQELIGEYVKFLEEHPGEIVEGLTTLIEASNRHNYFIDEILNKFSDDIDDYRKIKQTSKSNYKEPSLIFRRAVFFQNYALYYFRKALYEEGIYHLLFSMELSILLNSKDLIVNNMALFELHRKHASLKQCNTYSELCRKVWENEKESILGGFGYNYG